MAKFNQGVATWKNLTIMDMIEKIINFSELSRYVTGGDRNNLRPGRIPKKWWPEIDRLIHTLLPEWWEKYKKL